MSSRKLRGKPDSDPNLKNTWEAWEPAQLVKCLHYEHEDLNSISRTHGGFLVLFCFAGTVACTWNRSAERVETGGFLVLMAGKPSQICESQTNERSCLKKQGAEKVYPFVFG